MDAGIAEIIGSDGASLYGGSMGGYGGGQVAGPSGQASFSIGSASGNGASFALMTAVLILMIVYWRTNGKQK